MTLTNMSRSGNCWDTACIESFFGHMKDELNIKKDNRKGLKDFRTMKQMIETWVEEYNNVRPHSTLKKGLSPIEYRKRVTYNKENRLQ